MDGDIRRVRLNEQETVAKLVDGEAILINLITSIYFSMDGTGAFIWSRIEEGEPLDAIAARLASAFDVAEPQARADLDRLVGELLEHRLVVADDGSVSAVSVDGTHPAEKAPYVAPKLNTYADMGDLLALDPPVPGFELISWEK
jgi:hypothetical protein